MKIAIIMSGNLRNFHLSYNFLEKDILDPLKNIGDTDIFIHTWDKIGAVGGKCETSESINSSTDDIKDFVIEKLNPKRMIIEKSITFNLDKYERDIPYHNPTRGLKNMFYGIDKVNELREEYEFTNKFVYDRVLRLRPDLFYKQPLTEEIILNPKLDSNYIYIPKSFEVETAGDVIAIGNSKVMTIYSSLFYNIDEYFDAGIPFNPERMLRSHLDFYKINIITDNFSFLFVRSDGTIA